MDQLVEETGLTEIDICEALNDLFQLGILEKQVKKTKKGVVALLMLKQPVAMSLKRIVK